MSQGLTFRKQRQWEERIGRYRSGGLTVARFCEKEGVSPNTFLLLGAARGLALDQAWIRSADQTPEGDLSERGRLEAMDQHRQTPNVRCNHAVCRNYQFQARLSGGGPATAKRRDDHFGNCRPLSH